MNLWDVTFAGAIIAGAVRLATPVALAAIGETIVERGGMINIGIDGIMTIGAFAAIYIESIGGGWGLALVVSLCVGAVFGHGHRACRASRRRQPDHRRHRRVPDRNRACGVFLSIMGRRRVGEPRATAGADLANSVVRDVPLIGKAISDQSLLTYGTLILMAVCCSS